VLTAKIAGVVRLYDSCFHRARVYWVSYDKSKYINEPIFRFYWFNPNDDNQDHTQEWPIRKPSVLVSGFSAKLVESLKIRHVGWIIYSEYIHG
jgi:hypothetical protein